MIWLEMIIMLTCDGGSRVLVDLSPRSFSSLDDGCAVGMSAASEAASRSSQSSFWLKSDDSEESKE